MSADVATCELCGWPGAGLRHEPNDCARYLQIKQMFLAGMSRYEIGRELGIASDEVLYILTGLEVKRQRVSICAACGWQGVIALHKPCHCSHYSQVRKMHVAGVSRDEIAREPGISNVVMPHAAKRLGIERPRPEALACQVCGWYGESIHSKAHSCARYLQIKTMYLTGMSLRAVAREIGATSSAVLYVLKRLGVKRQSPGGRNNPLGLNGRLP